MTIAVFDDFSIHAMPKLGNTALADWGEGHNFDESLDNLSEYERDSLKKADQLPIYVPWRNPFQRLLTGLCSGILVTIREELEAQNVPDLYSQDVNPYYERRFFEMLESWALSPDFSIRRISWHTYLIPDFYNIVGLNHKKFFWFPLEQLSLVPAYMNKKYGMNLRSMPKSNVTRERTWGPPYYEYERFVFTCPKAIDALMKRARQDYVPEKLLDLSV